MNEYNGWTNRETWVVDLWVGDNTDYLDDLCERCDYDTNDVADSLKKYVTETLAERENLPAVGLFQDLLSGALLEVNWSELAETYITNAKEAR